jgi:hypothetical protein
MWDLEEKEKIAARLRACQAGALRIPGSAAHPCLRGLQISSNSRLAEASRQEWAALPETFFIFLELHNNK